MTGVARCVEYGRALSVSVTLVLGMGALTPTDGQSVFYSRGQNIAPAFEGWEENPDGTFDMIFGYLNRNLDEFFHIAVGPNNNVEPGGPDQGGRRIFSPLAITMSSASECRKTSARRNSCGPSRRTGKPIAPTAH